MKAEKKKDNKSRMKFLQRGMKSRRSDEEAVLITTKLLFK